MATNALKISSEASKNGKLFSEKHTYISYSFAIKYPEEIINIFHGRCFIQRHAHRTIVEVPQVYLLLLGPGFYITGIMIR